MGRSMIVQGLSRCWGASVLVCLLALVSSGGTTAVAASLPVVFDPVLSLTGGCTVSTLDEVPDPGCPSSPGPPLGPFSSPRAVATDAYGNIYVASFGKGEGSQGRVDVFDSSGHFITEVAIAAGPLDIAVDSIGTLYVSNLKQGERVTRYSPTVYNPASGEIEYGNPPAIFIESFVSPALIGIAVNPTNDHLFVYRSRITEYGSAAEGNPELEEFPTELGSARSTGLAIDAAHNRVYASGAINGLPVIKIVDLAPPHLVIGVIDGSTTPAGKFLSDSLTVAVDEGSGRVFVYDPEASKLYEFTSSGGYLATIEHRFVTPGEGAQITVDNGKYSPNGGENPFGRYVFVPSYPGGEDHSYAFAPLEQCSPEVKSVSAGGVTEAEAVLEAIINPCNLGTTYTFEYVTQQSFDESGFAGAQAVSGTLPAAVIGMKATAPLRGLAAGTAYRFRVIAANEEGSNQLEGTFATYPANPVPPCPNDPLRYGFSAALPDCRAYELVSPPDTNGRPPLGIGALGSFFTTREASPAGDKVSFRIEGGSMPGVGGTGSLFGDPYLSIRGAGGWSTSYVGPSGAEAPAILPGSSSPDQSFSLWDNSGGSGSTAIGGERTSYVRYPDGHSELVGRGALGTDPRAVARLISEGGEHIIFTTGNTGSAVQLEENASPAGTQTVYDRTADEVTHVVSLLPGDVTPKAGENAIFKGASLDGKGVAFSIGNTLYLRHDNAETYEIGENVTFAGIAEGGGRVFYVNGGDLVAFDVASNSVIEFTTSGDITPVNVSADGSAAYFVSPSALSSGPNSQGVEPKKGQHNLYLSREGAISFVGTVTERDVEGELWGGEQIEGLGLWTAAVGGNSPGQLGIDPSRTTPDGRVLLFESRANLTSYNSEGHVEVYRYDSAADDLRCLSCDPTLGPASGTASLQPTRETEGLQPLNSFVLVNNLRADGRRVFFQSTEPLVAADTDGLQDVYEWEAQGVGSCTDPDGCVYLISSGNSRRNDYLYAASDSGDDVFFLSSDLLLPIDSDETPSIYDARVGGGFAEPDEADCQGEGCRPGLAPPPGSASPLTPVLGKGDNVRHPRRCPKGKRRVKRHGKVRCVKRHHRPHHHKAGSKRKGAGK